MNRIIKSLDIDQMLSRVSNLITISMFVVQIPALNTLFLNQFTNTTIAFKLMISVLLIFTCSYSLNKYAFKVDKVFFSAFSTFFLVNLTFMFLESIVPGKMLLVAFALYFFSDWTGLKAAQLDSEEFSMFEWMKAAKVIAYVIFIFVTSSYFS